MATRKGFLDLPAELRNQVYENVICDKDHLDLPERQNPACTKRPGALIDRWHKITHESFFKNEMFQSNSAIVATNHQIHAEFYATLYDHIVSYADLVTIHILDFDFKPLIDWLSSLTSQKKARFLKGGGCSIQLIVDFEIFKPVAQTTFKEWLLFAAKLNISLTTSGFAMLHPVSKEWIRHGPSYPIWWKKYHRFVEGSGEQMLWLLHEAIVSDAQLEMGLRHYYSDLFYAMRKPLGDYYKWTEKEKYWWSAHDLEAHYLRLWEGDEETM